MKTPIRLLILALVTLGAVAFLAPSAQRSDARPSVAELRLSDHMYHQLLRRHGIDPRVDHTLRAYLDSEASAEAAGFVIGFKKKTTA